ncbi:MAG: hypothetical protein OEX15_13760, partial [Gammaproteobacteria bacterium]|nr:hypothetical protein [Gammaproteobacteria bacterium]
MEDADLIVLQHEMVRWLLLDRDGGLRHGIRAAQRHEANSHQHRRSNLHRIPPAASGRRAAPTELSIEKIADCDRGALISACLAAPTTKKAGK